MGEVIRRHQLSARHRRHWKIRGRMESLVSIFVAEESGWPERMAAVEESVDRSAQMGYVEEGFEERLCDLVGQLVVVGGPGEEEKRERLAVECPSGPVVRRTTAGGKGVRT